MVRQTLEWSVDLPMGLIVLLHNPEMGGFTTQHLCIYRYNKSTDKISTVRLDKAIN